MGKKVIEKEAIIAEYLTGENSYRKLGNKYGIDFRLIHSWVMKYEGKKRKPSPKQKAEDADEMALPTDVKKLQAELRNKLLNAIIDIAEDQLKIDIRKKSGTKR